MATELKRRDLSGIFIFDTLPGDEINQAIKGATLSWATEKDEKEGTETPAGGDDNGGEDNGGDNGGGNNNPPGELEG